MLGGRLADDQRKILVLAIVAMEECQLLVAVGGVIGGIQVEGDDGRQRAAVLFLEALDAGGDGEVDQPLQRLPASPSSQSG